MDKVYPERPKKSMIQALSTKTGGNVDWIQKTTPRNISLHPPTRDINENH